MANKRIWQKKKRRDALGEKSTKRKGKLSLEKKTIRFRKTKKSRGYKGTSEE